MSSGPDVSRLIAEAFQHVPLYQRLWGNPGSFPRQLVDLPLLTKADLLSSDPDERLDRRFAGRPLKQLSTSGSTGQPLTLLLDRATERRRQARFLWALWRCGYRPGQRLMLISSRPANAIKQVSPWARLARWHYADLYLGADELVNRYRQIRPDVVYGPLSALLTLGEAPHGHHAPRTVISTSEQLTPSMEQRVKASLGVDVTDFFGMTELGLVACKLGGSPRYVTPKGAFILEYLPCNDASGLERLVVTDLAAGAMPFIRYDTGDLVRRDFTRPDLPIVEFAGKQLDFLTRPDGSRVSPYEIDRALGELAGMRQYHVIQESDYSVHAYLTTDGGDAADLKGAEEGLRALCAPLPVHLHADASPVTAASNKSRPVISHVRAVRSQ